jgi:hypothetical protein
MNRLILPLKILLLLTLPAFSQTDRKPLRTCRIIYLMAPPDAPKSLHLFDGKTSREVHLPRMNFSDVYQVTGGDATLRLVPEAVVDPEMIPRCAPSVKIPESVSDLYLIVSNDPANPVAPVRMQMIDADGSRFKTGQIMWFNLTARGIAGRVGDTRLLLRPNARTVTDSPSGKAGSYPVKLDYYPDIKGPPQPLCETTWNHDPRSRMVAFIFSEPDREAPRVFAFPDYRIPEKPGTHTP